MFKSFAIIKVIDKMNSSRKSGPLTLIDSSFAWLGQDGGYRVIGADSVLWAHWLFGLKEKAYDVLGYRNLRTVDRYCKENNISFTHGMVTVRKIRQYGDFLEGYGKVESRSKSIEDVYDVTFGGVIKKTNDVTMRNISLKKIYFDCGCQRARKLPRKVVKEEVRNMYNDKRNPNDCVVTVSMCFHSVLLMYELVGHHDIDGYDQFGLKTQTNFFAIHELGNLLYRRMKPSEMNNFHLKTNFFNPSRKILGIPLVV